MRPLRALLLSDGRPGHFRLAEGILAATARRREVVTTRLEVRRRVVVPARVVSHMVNGGVSPARILRLAFGIDGHDLPLSDLVVSAGGNTLGANIACARILEASNIFYGSLRRFRPADFSLVYTSYAGQALAQNQVMTLKPSAVDPDVFSAAGGIDGSGDRAAGVPDVCGLIVGGDSGTVRYTNKDWQGLFAFIDACHERFGTRWIVSNSPRTPQSVSRVLEGRMADGLGQSILSFIDVRDRSAASLDELFARAGAVVCSADSSTMVSECVWARRRVVAVYPGHFRLPDNERSYREWLFEKGWAVEMAISELAPEAFASALGALTPLNDNPLERLADDLERRLPSLFK